LGDFVQVDFVLFFFEFQNFLFESDVKIFVVGFGEIDVFDFENNLCGVGFFGLEEASEEFFGFFLDCEVSHDEIEEEGCLESPREVHDSGEDKQGRYGRIPKAVEVHNSS
jgi:hypothetical protein